jgi:hypothetical protein
VCGAHPSACNSHHARARTPGFFLQLELMPSVARLKPPRLTPYPTHCSKPHPPNSLPQLRQCRSPLLSVVARLLWPPPLKPSSSVSRASVRRLPIVSSTGVELMLPCPLPSPGAGVHSTTDLSHPSIAVLMSRLRRCWGARASRCRQVLQVAVAPVASPAGR